MTPEELEDWLNARPEETRRQEAVWIAHRCAMRVLPLWWQATQNHDLTASPVLRANLILGVAALVPTPKINRAATYATYAASAGAAAARAAASASARATASASAGAAARAAATATALQRDVDYLKNGNPPDDLALWSDPVPDLGWSDWQRDSASRPNGPWAFWTDWYRRAHDGLPQPMDLLEKIALQPEVEDGEDWDPDTFWDGTDAEVNIRIAEIVAEWEAGQKLEAFIEQHPYANRIEADPAKKKLVSVPAETVDLTDIVDRIRQAAKDFTAGCRKDKSPNKIGEQMQSAFAPVIADIRRDLRRHRTDPLKLFDSMELARRAMGRIARAEGFPPEGPSGRLMDELATSCEDICIASPEVLETQRHRIAVRTELFSFEQKIVALRLCAGLHENADGHLRATAALAINTILDSASSEDAKKHAWYFMIAVIPRGARAMRQADMKPADKEQSDSMLKRAAEAGNQLSSIDRGIDAAQEMAGEGANWVDGVLNLFGSGGFPGIGG
ncbi:hypothetical protein JQU42_05635 [Ponticoccus sp. SC6-7]|uniref:hypothetical protein n=1 Tax=Alexandriicola marinus TaxID=2081710 RepID=UPI000FD9DB21|nr:hypothetical protein [Alexandriicola marinus]MBM1219486.1 hypothetical protein [Ponticoccus sp. SC6-9]MBM1223442.1 hypothetical protein [Ponticoccus sp. SC6-15]MBM1229299.1 hypothetical protein [Ponticoccus sp. SC6-38]MBM1237642.1 hypothetical protein [Ponticoccus sp. SC6-49]MBM1250410.1 hypothetical protein [Ponticoccus sp. SC6-33]MBM1260157.1 hypothetical protein [Ponticoccus sp. SC6-31]MBM1264476.1 hypothetical protein [Ponticoccus sp. SC2-67]MBM1272932.1 hypothetical protein [Pontico